jgi:hypothetical protein
MIQFDGVRIYLKIFFGARSFAIVLIVLLLVSGWMSLSSAEITDILFGLLR